MFDLIESLILSDVTIILLLVAMLGVVTSWAMRNREYPGYLLGWLAGILIVIVYRSLGGQSVEPVSAGELVEDTEVTLSFFTVLLSVVLGLVVGYFMLFAAQRLGGTPSGNGRGRRGLTIAVMTASLIVTIFALTIAGADFRRTLGLFALSVAVGALSNVVIGATPTGFLRGRGQSQSRFTSQNAPPPTGGNPYGNPPPPVSSDDAQRKFEELRRKVEGRD